MSVELNIQNTGNKHAVSQWAQFKVTLDTCRSFPRSLSRQSIALVLTTKPTTTKTEYTQNTKNNPYANWIYTVCQKSSQLYTLCNLSNINRFSNFCSVVKRKKFATIPMWHHQHHLRHVAALPWEIKNANFLQIFRTYGRKCKQIAFLSPPPSLFIYKFRYFQCLK